MSTINLLLPRKCNYPLVIGLSRTHCWQYLGVITFISISAQFRCGAGIGDSVNIQRVITQLFTRVWIFVTCQYFRDSVLNYTQPCIQDSHTSDENGWLDCVVSGPLVWCQHTGVILGPEQVDLRRAVLLDHGTEVRPVIHIVIEETLLDPPDSPLDSGPQLDPVNGEVLILVPRLIHIEDVTSGSRGQPLDSLRRRLGPTDWSGDWLRGSLIILKIHFSLNRLTGVISCHY